MFGGTRSFIRASILLGLLVATGATPLFAVDPTRALTQYIVTTWQTEQGLPQNTVFAIRQTRDGYLWLGTEEGLVRFDGVGFVIFDKRNTPQIHHNWVQSLLETKDGSLWAAIVGGGLVRNQKGSFTSFTTAEGLPNDSVWDVAEDRDGSLWVATEGGLARFRDGRFTAFKAGQGLPNEQVRVLLTARDGSLWVGTDGGGLAHLHNGRFDILTTADGLSSNVIGALLERGDGSVWAGTSAGLDQLRDGRVTASFKRENGLPGDYIRTLYEDRHGILWVGTGEGGLARLSNGVFSSLTAKDGLSSDDIRAFREDREGNLWVGTGGGGVSRFRDGKFTVFTAREGLAGDNIRSVLEDHEGSIWVGGRGGLSRLRAGGIVDTYRRSDGLAGESVFALHEDPSGSLWIGTESGLSRFRAGIFESFTTREGLSHNGVRAITSDREGRLWIGTDEGLNLRLENGGYQSFTTKDGLPNNTVLALYAARDGTLWIGTRGGLASFSAGKFIAFSDGPLRTAPVISLHEDEEGFLWVATGAVGLFRLKQGKVDAFSTRLGLFDDTLMETLEDAGGNFWVGCNRGIFTVSKRELAEVAAGKRKTVTSTVYGLADGLRAAECNGGSQPAGWRGRDGRLWFSTIRGVAVIDPQHIARNAIAPPVVIEGIDGGGQHERGRIELAPGVNDLQIHYTALSLSNPERVHFRYRLEGFDQRWVEAGARRTAYYTNIPPGSYTFRVIAANEDGVWNEKGTAIPITVSPRFHQTLWFQLIVMIAVGAILVGLDRLRQARLGARERQLEALVAERTASLQHALDEAERERAEAQLQRSEAEHQHIEAERHRIAAEEASRAKSAFLASMSHELRTPMNSIIGFTDILTQKLEATVEPKLLQFLSHVRTSAQHLLAIINDILDLSKVEMGKMEVFPETFPVRGAVEGVVLIMESISSRAGVAIEIDIDDATGSIETDAGKFKQILYNLLSNAVKFSPTAAIVTIAARRTGGSVVITVTDRGAGIAPDDMAQVFQEFRQFGNTRHSQIGTGLGLSLVRRFTELLRGTVTVDSSPGAGTIFTVALPERFPREEGGFEERISGPLILVLDEDDESWESIRSSLRLNGFAAWRSRSGREATAKLARLTPAAMILDLGVRGGEGWEVLARLRRQPATASLPIIVITSADDSHPAVELESVEVLIKPVASQKLIERLHRVLGVRKS